MRALILRLNKLSLDGSSFFFLGLAGVILEDMVHLLKGSTLGFGYKEEGPSSGKHTENGKEYIGTVSGILDQWWSDKALTKISR